MLDDELNILPISSHAAAITPVSKGVPADGDEAEAAEGRPAAGSAGSDSPELRELKRSLRETQPVGSIVQTVRTVDQAKALLTFVEAAADKSLRCTVALTAARGRGKSAALGLSLAAAVAYGYANIFVTAPSPENLRTLFEFVLKGFDALEYKEHADFSIVRPVAEMQPRCSRDAPRDRARRTVSPSCAIASRPSPTPCLSPPPGAASRSSLGRHFLDTSSRSSEVEPASSDAPPADAG